MEIVYANEWTALIVLALLVIYFVKKLLESRDLPPGPKGLPLVGYLPWICRGLPHFKFHKLAQKYGNIFSMQIGKRLVVVLNSYDTMRSAFTDQADIFIGRPGTDILRKKELPGIFQSEGKIWQHYKRDSVGMLKEFGFGTLNLEPLVTREVHSVIKMFEDNKNKPMFINDVVRLSFAHLILTVLFNRRLGHNDPRLVQLTETLWKFITRTQMINMEFFLPKSLLKIPFIAKILGYESPTQYGDIVLAQLRKLIEERVATHKNGDTTDFISTWLTRTEYDTQDGKDSVDVLLGLIRSLFNAGTDTMTLTLRWILLYLVANPSIQSRMQKEIDEVVGSERLPTVEDIKKLPFVEATILEGHRAASILPLSNRCNIEETYLEGYRIPKRSIVVANLWAVHHDPKIYPEPDKFRPERFIDDNGKICKPENYMPFSIGRRRCIGEVFASMSLFLYLSALLQRFTFVKADDDRLRFDYDRCFVSIPRPFRVIPVPRHTTSTSKKSL